MGATTAWLDDDEMEAWRAFIETVVDLMGALEADLAEHHLTMGDYQVLVFLSEVPDRAMRMCDLAARLQLSPSGVATVGRTRTGGPRGAAAVGRRSAEVMLAVLTEAGAAR